MISPRCTPWPALRGRLRRVWARILAFVRFLKPDLPADLYPSKRPGVLVDGPFTVVDAVTGRRLDIGHTLRTVSVPGAGAERVLAWEWTGPDRVHGLPAGDVDRTGSVLTFTPADTTQRGYRFEPVVQADGALLFPEQHLASDGALRARLRRRWGLVTQTA